MTDRERLQLIINQLLMSVADFAKSINVSQDTIYKILRGKTKLSPSVKGNVLKTYQNISREWFETGEGEMFLWKNKPELVNEEETKYTRADLCQEKDKAIANLEKLVSQQREMIDRLLLQIDSLQKK